MVIKNFNGFIISVKAEAINCEKEWYVKMIKEEIEVPIKRQRIKITFKLEAFFKWEEEKS